MRSDPGEAIDELTIAIARDFGWSIDETLDRITLHWWQAIERSWRRYPPIHVLVAGIAGWKPPPTVAASHPSISLIKAMYPDGIVRGGG